MDYRTLFDSINFLSDEDKTDKELIIYTNDAIAKVNMLCSSQFPFIELDASMEDEYEGFDETWQRVLFIPFCVGRSKQAESSQFEYSDAYEEFNVGLNEFKFNYTIPSYYKNNSLNPTMGVESFDNNPYRW